MKLSKIVMALTVTAALSASTAFASPSSSPSASADIDKCKISRDARGMLKASKSDCSNASSAACAERAKPEEANSWLDLPKGQCERINAGDLTGLNQEAKDKIEKIRS